MAIPRGQSDEEFMRDFFERYPDFYAGDTPDVDGLERADRRNPQFRRLFGQGRLLPPDPLPPEPSAEDRIFNGLEMIGAHPLATAEASIPESEQRLIDEQRRSIKEYIQGIRSGEIQPYTTSPEYRQTLIDQASGDFGRLLDQRTQQSLGELSRRGLFTQGAGTSGPAQDLFGRMQAEIYGDPITRFIQNLDIQTETDRVARQRQLRDIATELDSRLLGSGETMGQFLGNLGLGNLNSQRGFTTNLLGQLINESQFGRTLDFERERFEREQSILADIIAEQERQARRAESNTFQNLLGSMLPTLIGSSVGGIGAGLMSGGMTAGQGALLGGSIGSGNFGTAALLGSNYLNDLSGISARNAAPNDFSNLSGRFTFPSSFAPSSSTALSSPFGGVSIFEPPQPFRA